jgi:hypothetical protein
MKHLDRRTILGIGIATAATPAMATVGMIGRSPRERFEYHARELEKALLDCFPGRKIMKLEAEGVFWPGIGLVAVPAKDR